MEKIYSLKTNKNLKLIKDSNNFFYLYDSNLKTKICSHFSSYIKKFKNGECDFCKIEQISKVSYLGNINILFKNVQNKTQELIKKRSPELDRFLLTSHVICHILF